MCGTEYLLKSKDPKNTHDVLWCINVMYIIVQYHSYVITIHIHVYTIIVYKVYIHININYYYINIILYINTKMQYTSPCVKKRIYYIQIQSRVNILHNNV